MQLQYSPGGSSSTLSSQSQEADAWLPLPTQLVDRHAAGQDGGEASASAACLQNAGATAAAAAIAIGRGTWGPRGRSGVYR